MKITVKVGTSTLTHKTGRLNIRRVEELCKVLLPHDCFLRIHRSYLVNMDHVQSLSYKAITMSCQTEIPIPRGKYNEIKNAFLEYAFKNGQVTL